MLECCLSIPNSGRVGDAAPGKPAYGVLGRYLLRSMGILRRTALDVAHNRLPAAVASIRAGDQRVSIEPVPLRTTEEFGQLARAFDAVNGQAVRSAAEALTYRLSARL